MRPRVTDRFTTYQGSGHLVGKRQHFIRFAGCSVKCPIRAVCDEGDALDPRNGEDVAVEVLAAEALDAVGKFGWVHITGGEPCDQPEALTLLAMECERLNLRIHLHTSGMRQVPIRTDWLTISPKSHASALCWNRNRWAQEMIVVYDPKFIIDAGILHAFSSLTKCYDYYLQPLYRDNRNNLDETLKALEAINQTANKWDLTMQYHKHWGIK